MKTALIGIAFIISTSVQANTYLASCSLGGKALKPTLVEAADLGTQLIGSRNGSTLSVGVKDGSAAFADMMIMEIRNNKKITILKTVIQTQSALLAYSMTSNDGASTDINCELRIIE